MCLAMPGRVESIRDEAGVRMGRLDFGGVVRDVCLAAVPGIAVGDYAIVHVGFAIARLDEAAARATLCALAEIGFGDDAHDAPGGCDDPPVGAARA